MKGTYVQQNISVLLSAQDKNLPLEKANTFGFCSLIRFFY